MQQTQGLSQHWKVTKSNQGISLNELAALKLRSKIWTNFTSHTLLALLLVFKKLPEYEYESVTGDPMTLSLKRTRTVIDREPWKSSWDGSSSNYSSRYLKTAKFSNFSFRLKITNKFNNLYLIPPRCYKSWLCHTWTLACVYFSCQLWKAVVGVGDNIINSKLYRDVKHYRFIDVITSMPEGSYFIISY